MNNTQKNQNIGKSDNYAQVCVWQAMIVEEDDRHDFQEYFLQKGFRVILLESVTTGPDRDENGNVDFETGGRVDTLFAIHNDDVIKFAIPRLEMGIRWIEDVLDNEEEGRSIYPNRVTEYRSW